MDASVFNVVRSGGVRGPGGWWDPHGAIIPLHTHTGTHMLRMMDHELNDFWHAGSQAGSGTCVSHGSLPWCACGFVGMCVSLCVCACLRVCMCVYFMPSSQSSSLACQLLADLVLKRMHVAHLCRRVNLQIRSDWKTYWRLAVINRDCVRLCHTHTSDTQTSRPSVSSDVVRVQTTDRSKYLQPIKLLVSMPDQNLTVAFKGLTTLSRTLNESRSQMLQLWLECF